MNKRDLFRKQIPLALATFVTSLAQSIRSRRDREFSGRCGPLNSIYCSLITIPISLILKKGHNRNIRFQTLLVVSLFFVSQQLNFYFQPLLSAAYVTICSQPRLITIYTFSIAFMKNKLRVSNLIGISLIIVSLALLGFDKGGGSDSNFIRNCLFVSLASIFSGTAFFSFDYLVKDKVNCPCSYVIISQIFTSLFSISFLLFREFILKKKENYIEIIKNPDFHILSLIYTAFTVCVFVQSFVLGMISRVLVGIFIHTTSDVVTEWYIEGRITMSVAVKYSICMLGVLIYQSNQIRSYFMKGKRINSEGIP